MDGYQSCYGTEDIQRNSEDRPQYQDISVHITILVSSLGISESSHLSWKQNFTIHKKKKKKSILSYEPRVKTTHGLRAGSIPCASWFNGQK